MPTLLTCDLAIQRMLFDLGCIIHKNAGKIIFCFTLAMIALCVALKSAKIETNLDKLWIEKNGRVEKELNYVEQKLGSNYGTSSQIVLQTPKAEQQQQQQQEEDNHSQQQPQPQQRFSTQSSDNDIDLNNVLTVNSFIIHLEAMDLATNVSVDMFDQTWNLKHICYSPTKPQFDEFLVDEMLENIIPCAIKTPLDCFWEGSKLLGPQEPIPGLGFIKWTNLNPSTLVDTMRLGQPHSSFRYQYLIDWMKRVGISSAYQNKPCLVPSDPNCPITAPNKKSGEAPDIGAYLTGGCYGFATHLMHWHESEIVGGIKKNKTGFITNANALQSTIQLMDDQQMFEFWHKHMRVSNLDWSVEKARIILEAWQRKFKEKLTEFSQKSLEYEPFDVLAMTSTSIDELMDGFSSFDHLKLVAGYLVILIYTCISCPNIRLPNFNGDTNSTDVESPKSSGYTDNSNNNQTQNDKQTKLHSASPTASQECHNSSARWSIYERMTTIIMAKLGLIHIGLALAASLGLCVLIGLPFNAATTQLLPFLALCLGYHDLMILFQVFARNTRKDLPIESLAGECLREIGSGILISSFSCIMSFLAASIIPVPALRILSLQAMVFLIFNLLTIMVIIPSIFVLILRRESKLGVFDLLCCVDSNDKNESSIYIRTNNEDRKRNLQASKSNSMRSLSTKPESAKLHVTSSRDNQIQSRIKNDLMNVQFDCNHNSTESPLPSVYISASFNSNGMSATVRLSSTPTMNHATNATHISRSNHEAKYDKNRLNNSASLNDNDHSNRHGSIPDVAHQASRTPSQTPDVEENNAAQTRTTSISPLNLSVCDVRISTENYEPTCAETLIRAIANLLTRNSKVRILCILSALALFVFFCTGIPKVQNSLEFSDIVPRDTFEYKHLKLQRKYFPIFNTFAITKGNFEYPNNQKLLHAYHQAFTKIEAIDKNSEGGLPDFWLILFRDWLLELQKSFDLDRNASLINIDGWEADQASDNSILAYKLLVQTGKVDNPIDKKLFNTGRLVDANGIINPDAFYNYLTAWVSNDAFTYSLSEANFRPEPKLWIHDPKDTELKIPKSQPLVYAQSPYLMKMASTSDILETITDIRAICHQFEQRNLPNFPGGIPFAFWEQFFNLYFHLGASLIVTLMSIFMVMTLVTLNMGISFMITIISLINVVELYGLMGLASIPFNATQAVVLTIATGISVSYSIHMITTFIIVEGTKKERTIDTVVRIYSPIFNSWVCTSVLTTILILSQFDYIFNFTLIIQGSVALNAINSLIIIPVILASFGPKTIIVPNYNHQTVQMASITAEMRHKLKNMPQKYIKRRSYPRVQSEISLSTISEESNSQSYRYIF